MSKNLKEENSMLDNQGRIKLGDNLLKFANIETGNEVHVFFDHSLKCVILGGDEYLASGLYYVSTIKVDMKARIYMPVSIRNAFPDHTYLPTFKDNKICIFIIKP